MILRGLEVMTALATRTDVGRRNQPRSNIHLGMDVHQAVEGGPPERPLEFSRGRARCPIGGSVASPFWAPRALRWVVGRLTLCGSARGAAPAAARESPIHGGPVRVHAHDVPNASCGDDRRAAHSRSARMWYSGVDLHERSIALQPVDVDGTVVRQARIPAQREVRTAYFATLSGPHQAVVGCTGRCGTGCATSSPPRGLTSGLGHAKSLKAISDARVEPDAVQGATLAQLRRAGLIPEAHMVSSGTREARDLSRSRLALGDASGVWGRTP